VADITYVHLAEEFGYLAVILDAFGRKVVLWAPEGIELAISALMMAITARRPIRGAQIRHSDRGEPLSKLCTTASGSIRLSLIARRSSTTQH
jgi:hypothetical protein